MSTEYSRELGKILRETRERKGVGLRKLARDAELSPSYLSELESGESEPTVSKLQRIAEQLGVAISRLLPRKSGSKDFSKK